MYILPSSLSGVMLGSLSECAALGFAWFDVDMLPGIQLHVQKGVLPGVLLFCELTKFLSVVQPDALTGSLPGVLSCVLP